ncbi:sinIM [Symbiodinium sp. CCMP2592]|nr:sinIM [Symbiodinium sp. CCMP2592]
MGKSTHPKKKKKVVPKKKPASKTQKDKTEKLQADLPNLPLPLTTTTPFDGKKFMAQLLEYLPEQRPEARSELRWGSGFDGLDTITQALSCLEVQHEHAFGAEISKTAATWVLKRAGPKHLFQDVMHTSRSSAYCLTHGQKCKVPGSDLQLYAAGNSCKSNSIRNPKRWTDNPMQGESGSTFSMTVDVLVKWQPRFFLIENVVGARPERYVFQLVRPCKVGSAADSQDKKSPLEIYLETLRSRLPGYDIEWVEVGGHPLPERRERLWILGSRDPEFGGKAWTDKVRELELKCVTSLPIVHLSTMFEKGGDAQPPPPAADPSWKDEATYHSTFAKMMSRSIEQKKVTKDAHIKPLKERASQVMPALGRFTAWQKANVDALEVILNQTATRVPKSFPLLPIADISQSTAFARTSVVGTWSTLTTATMILNFQTGKIEPPRSHFQMLGWPADVELKGFSDPELYDMCGNAMSVAAVCKVLAPVLRHLKCF